MVSFAVQKLYSLLLTYLFIFAFVVFAFGVKSQNSLPRATSRSLCPVFSSKSFMVSGLTFKSLIHFELILCMVYEVQFHSFACGSPVSPTPFIEETALSLWCTLSTFAAN